MITQKTEDHHHSPKQIAGYLDEARRLLLEAGFIPEEHEATFAAVVTLLASKQVFYEQIAPMTHLPRGAG